jgi:hypothetical protein
LLEHLPDFMLQAQPDALDVDAHDAVENRLVRICQRQMLSLDKKKFVTPAQTGMTILH